MAQNVSSSSLGQRYSGHFQIKLPAETEIASDCFRCNGQPSRENTGAALLGSDWLSYLKEQMIPTTVTTFCDQALGGDLTVGATMWLRWLRGLQTNKKTSSVFSMPPLLLLSLLPGRGQRKPPSFLLRAGALRFPFGLAELQGCCFAKGFRGLHLILVLLAERFLIFGFYFRALKSKHIFRST